MNGLFFVAITVFFYLYTYYLFIKQKKSCKKMDNMYNIIEKFQTLLDDDNDKTKINNLSKIMRGEAVSVQKLRIDGNVDVIGKLCVNNESHFNGGRHYFYNNLMTDKIRVGAAYGLPGIYTDNELSLKASSGNVYFLNYPQLENGGSLTVNNEKKVYST